MGEAGILTRSDRVELIRGEIIKRSPQGRRHRAFIDNLTRLLERGSLGARSYRSRCRSRSPTTPNQSPTLIEVGESSLAYDRSTKLRLYATAGIPEYWVVDCVAESVEVHRGPHADGYRDATQVTGPTATIALQAFPDVALALGEIFA